MKDVMTQGTGTPAYFGSSMAQAGKSGTTTKNRDALFAGFTPYYTCVVWGGYDDNAVQNSGQDHLSEEDLESGHEPDSRGSSLCGL